MRTSWAALCFAILGLACGALSRKQGGDAMTNTNNEVISLSATFTITEKNLEIDYSVVNRGALPVFVLDKTVIVDPHGAATVGPAPRIEYLPPGTVVISNKLFPIPRGTRMAVPPSAYGERLDAGVVKHSRITLPLPLKDRVSRISNTSHELACNRIRFVVSAVPDSPDLHAEEQTIAGVPLWRLGRAAWGLQQEAAIEHSLASPVRVVVGE